MGCLTIISRGSHPLAIDYLLFLSCDSSFQNAEGKEKAATRAAEPLVVGFSCKEEAKLSQDKRIRSMTLSSDWQFTIYHLHFTKLLNLQAII